MIKYKLGRVVKKDGKQMESSVVKVLSQGTYIEMNDDNTLVLSIGTAEKATPMNLKVEGNNFTLGPALKFPFETEDGGKVIVLRFQGDFMYFVNEALYEPYVKMVEAALKVEDSQKVLEIAKLKEEELKLNSRKYTLIGVIYWNEDGSQEMVKATEPKEIVFYGGNDGYDDKHYVWCSCKGLGDGTWEKSHTVRGEYDLSFGGKDCTVTFEEAGKLVYLLDGEVTYHFLKEGEEMPQIAKLNWEED